jgi:hypothetical protein
LPTGFDRLPEADVVRQEYPSDLAGGDFVQQIELMGYQLDPGPLEASDVRLPNLRLGLQRAKSQIEDFVGIAVARDQQFLRRAAAGEVGDGVFPDALALAHVAEHPGFLFDRYDHERSAIAGADGLADAKEHPLKRGGARGVQPFFAGGGESDLDAARIHAHDHAKAQFGLPFAHPPLANRNCRHSGDESDIDRPGNASLSPAHASLCAGAAPLQFTIGNPEFGR